ncbi:hypothetical protein HGRIS_011840 [Hohenbuehelia grisea]|uniref:Oxidoreductase N-terminal domain-containing protein n=1 Tax=Hohenbuehelia grisea TaxID=104357 RepID=A0ABR3JWH9_9AGAR
MSPLKNGRHLFNEVPEGYPVPGKTTVYDETQTIDLDNVPLNGGILIKVLVLSIDPYMRGKMRLPSAKSYSPPFEIGKPLENHGVGLVLRSESSDIKVGDHVYGVFSFQQYIIKPNSNGVRVLQNQENLPWSNYIGAAGMPGQTAFFAWKEYSKAKKGETVYISTGAGPVGS